MSCEVYVINLNLDQNAVGRLQKLLGTGCYDFLGFTLNVDQCTIKDNLFPSQDNLNPNAAYMITTLLAHYSTASLTPPTGRQVKFRDLPGGYAYEGAFVKRAIQPIAEAFGENSYELCRAGKILGGRLLGFGDASIEVPALKGISLTYIVWGKEEYPGSANILYDESACKFLPTEDLAVLGEITSERLISATNLMQK
jgi:hypothetical protein